MEREIEMNKNKKLNIHCKRTGINNNILYIKDALSTLTNLCMCLVCTGWMFAMCILSTKRERESKKKGQSSRTESRGALLYFSHNGKRGRDGG